MKTIFQHFLLITILVITSTNVQAQNCLRSSCGTLKSSWIPVDVSEACEGIEFQLDPTQSTPADSIVEYRWYFIEEATGRILEEKEYPDPRFATFTYEISDSIACELPNSSILLLASLEVYSESCDTGISCDFKIGGINVKLKPRARFEIPLEICVGEPLEISNMSCHANEYEWLFSDTNTTLPGDIPAYSFSTPGPQTVQLIAFNDNGCGSDTLALPINVVGQPEVEFSFDSSPPDNRCENAIINFEVTANEWARTRWEIEPVDTNRWCFTDTLMTNFTRNISVRFKQEGEYDFKLIGSNACPEADEETALIEIFEEPNFFLIPPELACDELTLTTSDLIDITRITGDAIGYEWTFENGSIPSASRLDFGQVTFTESGRVTLTVLSECGNIPRTVDVVVSSTEAINLSSNQSSFCQSDTIVQLLPSTGGRWTISPSSNALTSSGELDLSRIAARDYTLTFRIDNEDCPNEAELDIEVREAVGVELDPVAPECEELNLNTSDYVSYEGEIDKYEWFLDGVSLSINATPSFDFEPVNDTLTVIVSGECGEDSASIPIFVQADTDITITTDRERWCSGSAPDTLSVNAEDGIWVSDDGGFIDNILGIFDPGSVEPGDYTVRYELENGACDSRSNELTLTVVTSASTTIRGEIICTDSPPIQLEVDATGGTWSGTGVDENGIFEPANLNTDTTYVVAYDFVDENGCDVHTEGFITVESLPIQSTRDSIQLCLSDIDVDLVELLDYSVSREGGTVTWSGTGIQDVNGTFNSNTLAVGFYPVFVEYSLLDCIVRDSAIVEIIEATPLEISSDTIVCISDSILVLDTNLSGGRWEGIGINADGTIDLSVGEGGNTITYTYFFLEGTNCEQEASLEVEIVDLRNEVQAGDDIEVCEGISEITLTGAMPLDGTWRGAGINPNTGRIDITALDLDTTYIYTYEIESDRATACAAEDSRMLIIHSNPIADFELDGTACVGDTFQLQNNSTNAVRYEWNLDDGTSSQDTEPIHEYSTSGNKTIELTAYSEFECSNTTQQTLFVTTPPNPSFSIPIDEGCAPFELEVNNASDGFEIMQRWFINGDTISGAALENIILDGITTDTTFVLLLEVENLCGIREQEAEILVHPYPIADFGINQDEGCSPSLIEFYNITLGNPDRMLWNFGNGTSFPSMDSLLYQTYTTSDTTISTYTIDLLATNECGQDSISKKVEIFPPNIRAFIEQDTLRGCTPLAISLESFSTPGADVSWRLLDKEGNELEGYSSKILSDTLVEAGIYLIELAAAKCGIHFDTAYVEVLPAPLVAFETDRPFVCVGDSLSFINLSQNFNGSSWDFGDDMTSTARNPIHHFDFAGVYEVSLRVISEAPNSCPATIIQTVDVVDNPIANFSLDTTSGCLPLEIQLDSESTGFSTLNYLWTFTHIEGDCSDASNEMSPTHRFDCPGQYAMTLQVSDENQCMADTSIANIFVFDLPESDFTFEDKQYCLGYDAVELINQSSEDAIRFEWVIESDTLRQQNPVFEPTQAGQLSIELISYNQNGCVQSSIQQVQIEPSPIADFAPDVSQGCEDLRVQFTNASTSADSYVWEFDNENSSTDENPSQNFTEAGNYEVILTAMNSNGCPASTRTTEIEVYPKPIADFDIEKTRLCGTPSEVHFLNLSELNEDNSWRFGDSGDSEETSPSHAYQSSGIFEVELIVETAQNCADTLVQSLDIFGQPQARADISPMEGCEDLAVRLVDNSIESLSTIWQIEDFPPVNSATYFDTISEAGSYDLRLIAIYNESCQDTLLLEDAIRVYERPMANFDYIADSDPNILGDVQFTNLSINYNRVRWDFGDNTNSTVNNPFHEYDINRDIDVLLTAYNDNGGAFTCLDTARLAVAPEWQRTFFAPNAFAPEYGVDGVNVFKPVGIGIADYEITVYSPWGNEVWHTTNIEEAWNGQVQNTGKPLPQGAYLWHAWMRFDDGNEYEETGTVTLLR